MPLVVVVPLAPSVSEIVLPSITICSAAPSLKLPTVKVKALIVCPASTVEIATLEKRSTAAPSSVKLGLLPVAVKVGASLTA